MRILFLLLVTSLPAFAESYNAQRVPSTNLIPWVVGSTVGVRGGITNRPTVINLADAPYSVPTNGTSEVSDEIQAAVTAELGTEKVLYLPSGHYRIGTNINIPAPGKITIRGNGVTTVLDMTNSCNQCFDIGADSSYLWSYPSYTNWASGVTRGSTNISVLDGTSFDVGKMIRLGYELDTNVVFSVGYGGGNYFVGPYGFLYSEMKVIEAVANVTNLTIWPPIYLGTNPSIRAKATLVLSQASGVGIESMYINGTNASTAAHVAFEQCINSWATNLVTRWSSAYGVSCQSCLFLEFNYCDIRDIVSVGSNHGGLLYNLCSGGLIHNNIIGGNFPIIEMNSGSSGNVFGYNFLYDAWAGRGGGAGFMMNHGPFNAFNLVEGNMTPNIISDGNSGGEGFETLHRNWMFGIGPAVTNTYQLALKRFSRYWDIENNVIGLEMSQQTNLLDALKGEPNIGNSSFLGTCSPSTGDYWTNYICFGVITNRTSDTQCEVHVLDAYTNALLGVRGGNNLAPLDQPWWSVATLSWDGVIYPPYCTFTNIGINNIKVRVSPGFSGDAYPSDGTSVKVWFGNGLGVDLTAPYQELDQDVSNTVSVANNWLIPVGVPSYQVVSGSTNSYYLTAKPFFFPSSYAWPSIGADIINATPALTNQTLTNYVLIPAQSAFLNSLPGGIGGDWPDGGLVKYGNITTRQKGNAGGRNKR